MPIMRQGHSVAMIKEDKQPLHNFIKVQRQSQHKAQNIKHPPSHLMVVTAA